MDRQLKWIAGLLHDHSIPYWVDSGTLLGLMREGMLLEHDKDIDISLWSEHETELLEILPLIRRAGFRIWTKSYRDWIFAIQILPRNRTDLRTVDIKLFRKHAGHAWCPSPSLYVAVRDSGRVGLYDYASGLVAHLIHPLWLYIRDRISITSWPWHKIRLGTWWIPLFYLEKSTFVRHLNILAPQNWEGYLEYRYGDWKTSVKDWSPSRDDHAHRPKSPDEIMGNSKRFGDPRHV